MTNVLENPSALSLHLPLHGEFPTNVSSIEAIEISIRELYSNYNRTSNFVPQDETNWCTPSPSFSRSLVLKSHELYTDIYPCLGCSGPQGWCDAMEFGGVQCINKERQTTMTSTKSQGTERLLVTVNEACELLSIGRSTFYKEVSSGRILTVKIGNSTRVPTASLSKYCESKITESIVHQEKNLRWS